MADALVAHPSVGSVWLQRAKVVGSNVVGEVEDGNGYTEPRYATMNFPRTCVRRWSTPHAPDCGVNHLDLCDCEGGPSPAALTDGDVLGSRPPVGPSATEGRATEGGDR